VKIRANLELAAGLGPCCSNVSGVNLHAGVPIPALNKNKLERLYRYVCRPPVALDRSSNLADGRLMYKLKRRWRDGTTQVIYEPLEFCASIGKRYGRLHQLPKPAGWLKSKSCLLLFPFRLILT
jgi:hypothetical protein